MSAAMTKRHPVRTENLRRALAQEAARVMAEHGAQDRRQDQERREQGDEGVVGQQGREVVDAPVLQLAPYGRREGQDPVALLEGVEAVGESAQPCLRRLHGFI